MAASGKRRAPSLPSGLPTTKKQKVAEAESSKQKGLHRNLEPMSSIELCVADLTKRAIGLGLGPAVEALARQPLRVATMCSGTESPLLALRMISDGE